MIDVGIWEGEENGEKEMSRMERRTLASSHLYILSTISNLGRTACYAPDGA